MALRIKARKAATQEEFQNTVATLQKRIIDRAPKVRDVLSAKQWTRAEQAYMAKARVFTKKKKTWIGKKRPPMYNDVSKEATKHMKMEFLSMLRLKPGGVRNGFFSCPYCDERYYDFTIHRFRCKAMKTTKKYAPSAWICHICGREADLFNHYHPELIRPVNPDRFKNFKCSGCKEVVPDFLEHECYYLKGYKEFNPRYCEI
jgi:uncharacterized protein with PIN domain